MKMTITKAVAVAFLKALGFSKADKWDDEKILDRLAQVPEKVEESEAPKGHEDLYQELVKAEGKVQLVVEGSEPSEKESKTSKTKSSKKVEPKPVKKEKGKKKVEPERSRGTPRPVAERDSMGSQVGTISAKVNKVMNSEWQSEQEIAETAGVTLDQARGRLYYGAEPRMDIFERRRMIQYRLKKKKK